MALRTTPASSAGAQADARYRAPLRASPLASLCAALEYTSLLGARYARRRGKDQQQGLQADTPHSPTEPHVSWLLVDSPARCVRAPPDAPAQEEGACTRVRARACAATAATGTHQQQGFQAEEEHVSLKCRTVSGRGRCRRCRACIAKGETRLEVCAFVRPGRYTLLLRCTASACIDAHLSAAILSVYKNADRVPVDAALEGGAEAHRVVRAITSAGLNA